MSEFRIENNDGLCREGVLAFDNIEIPTPLYAPTRSEWDNLNDSPYTERDDYRGVKMGILGYWFNQYNIQRISSDSEVYSNLKNYLKRRISGLDTPVKLLHFDFYSEVNSLDITTLKLLLRLQNDIGADSIEIPNSSNFRWDYSLAIDKANDWKNNENIEKPIMGIASEPRDIIILKSKIHQIDSIGVSLRKENFPLLYQLEESIKPFDDTWVHGFSTQRSYRKIAWMGTLGMFLNIYGIDTVNSLIQHSAGIKNFILAQQEKTEDELLESSYNLKYFKPADYSTFKYETLEAQNGIDYKLSNCCNCPVCQNNTLESLVSDFELSSINTRAHEVISHLKESELLREKIRSNESNQYLTSKEFARRLSERE